MDNWTQWLPSVFVALLGYFAGRATNKAIAKKSNAEAFSIDSTTFQKYVDKVKELSDMYVKISEEIIEYKSEVEGYKNKLEEKENELIEFKADVRNYFAILIKWFEENGTRNYPVPPAKLFETRPKIKRQ